ncbi:S-adenosyl-L-methionine-dependent methyltransferase [Canariomyces notabilis]|uniref:S-adenosyl-L-methionine-dependent methyltransferase n=1 Tax=Canariomyces notabilis TaxID=2074819 RepID=A0AAN6YSW8_9PEZI|nr:S-adenosyl-L-methionine-dependent methyltransferase [Canariomyces arenarius]
MGSKSGFDLIQAAESLLQDAKKLVAATQSGPTSNDEEIILRQGIAQAAKKIAFETAPPIDVVKSDWIVLADVAAWNIFIAWKAFDHIPLPPGHISIRDLARAIDAQESLVARIANLLLSVGKLNPGPEPGTVAHSRVSPLYRSASPASALATVAVGNGMKPYAHWPEYFRTYGRREPPGQTHTPFSFAWNHPELAPWEVKALDPEYAATFARSMESRQIVGGNMPVAGPEALYDLTWVGEEARMRGEGEAVVVDVGGGLGQLLRDLIASVPGLKPGQCVLQDRKEVIEEAREAAGEGLMGVVMMEHDFHGEQPVKGAVVYLLRRILLDYPDELAIGILRQLAEALPVDNPKARIIIMEERLLETPTPMNCIVDLVMLNIGGKLRNEAMFGELAAAAGLRMAKYHARQGDPTCVVECARA